MYPQKFIISDTLQIRYIKHDSIMIGDGKSFELVCEDLPSAPEISPDSKCFLYISPHEWEELGELYIYDLTKRESRLLIGINDLAEQNKVKKAIWGDNKNLLLIIGFAYGTVSVGGDLVHYNFDTNTLTTLLKAEKQFEVQDIYWEEDIIVIIQTLHNQEYMYPFNWPIRGDLDEIIELFKQKTEAAFTRETEK